MKLVRNSLLGLIGVVFGSAAAVVALFVAPEVFVPIPERSYRLSDLVKGWQGDEIVDVAGYVSADKDGFVAFKFRISSPDYKPLVQRILDDSVPKGKVAKYPGLRVWLDELTLSGASARGGQLGTSTHMRARIVNDITGTDHKEKEIGITFDLGVDEGKHELVFTCQISNISSFPGDVEQLMNSGCSMRIPLCEVMRGIELHDVGHEFIGDNKMLGIELVGRVPRQTVIEHLKRALGFEPEPLTCFGATYPI